MGLTSKPIISLFFGGRRAQVLQTHAPGNQGVEAGCGTSPSSLLWASSQYARGPGRLGLLWSWATGSQKADGLRRFLACSVRSARTRNASAVTATSASFLVAPNTITPGNSGTSASHRPSVSFPKTMRKDSPLAVAAKLPFRNLQVQGERGLVAKRIMLSPKS
jgi:hypothetical protein